jgi:DNA-binding SARP family transcriptional activator
LYDRFLATVARTLSFGLLGPLEVRAEGSLLSAAKQKTILASLLLRAGEPVATDELVEALWPEGPPANAVTALQGYVLGLRRLLEPEAGGDYRVLVTRRPGYALELDPEQVDVRRSRTSKVSCAG